MESLCTHCGQPLVDGASACAGCGSPQPGPVSLAPGQSLEPTAREISIGDVLEDNWRVEKKLGEGGMGTVVLATDLQLHRLVAVKVLARHLCHDATSVARFEREARVTAGLDHPNIVPVYSIGRFYERPFIVMKYLEGQSLAEALKRRKGVWPWPDVRTIVEPLCQGLSYLHGRGLVHRDVKPSNVYLGTDGRVTLLDFGILKETSKDTTTTGHVLGTLRFMAPEQLTGDPPVDARADIYALGILLYRMLAGQTPFAGDDVLVAQRKLAEDPPSADSINRDLSGEMGALLRSAVSRQPSGRPASVRVLFDSLDAAARRAGPRRRGGVWRWLAAASMAMAVLTVGGVIASKVRQSAPVPTPTPAPTVVALPPAPVDARPEPGSIEATPSAVVTPSAGELAVKTAPRPQVGTAKHAKLVRVAPSEAAAKISVVTTVDGKSSYAELFVDGRSQGEAPTQLELKPGKHRIRLVRDGFRASESVLEVIAGRDERLVVDLKR